MKDKPLKIILESCDCAGKTTAYKELKKLYPDLDIVDRSFISDIVYAKKFNRTEYMGVPIQTYIDYWLYWHSANTNSCIVLFTATPETLATRALAKDEAFCRNRDFKQICEYLEKDDAAFKEVLQEVHKCFGFDFILVDTSSCDKEKTLDYIRNYIDGKL